MPSLSIKERNTKSEKLRMMVKEFNDELLNLLTKQGEWKSLMQLDNNK